MSSTIRSYTVSGGGGARKRKGRGIRRSLKYLFLLLLTSSFAYGFWVTRDTIEMGALTPQAQSYRIFAHDILEKRQEMAASQVWSLFPQDHWVHKAIQALSGDFGMPEWVLNNLINDLVYISGQDATTFSDPLFVTKMSRIGCFAERFHRFVPGVTEDYAGGLNLRKFDEAQVYYGVRGRVLIISPSRKTLIHALTLTDEEALGETQLRADAGASEAKSVHGNIQLQEESALGAYLASLHVALDLHSHHVRFLIQASLRDHWKEEFSALFEGATPIPLKRPPEGMITLSADFGKPIPLVVKELMAFREEPLLFEDLLAQAIDIESPQGQALKSFLPAFWNQLGSGLRMAWTGADLNEMLPMPELLCKLDIDPALMQEFLSQIPAPPQGVASWESFPRYDADKGIAFLPMIGGPSIEPTCAIQGDSLLLSTSRTVAEKQLASHKVQEDLNQAGNLYLRLQPDAIVTQLSAIGEQFAEFGLLRGLDKNSFLEVSEVWHSSTQKVREIAALAAIENQEEIQLDLRMTMVE